MTFWLTLDGNGTLYYNRLQNTGAQITVTNTASALHDGANVWGSYDVNTDTLLTISNFGFIGVIPYSPSTDTVGTQCGFNLATFDPVWYSSTNYPSAIIPLKKTSNTLYNFAVLNTRVTGSEVLAFYHCTFDLNTLTITPTTAQLLSDASYLNFIAYNTRSYPDLNAFTVCSWNGANLAGANFEVDESTYQVKSTYNLTAITSVGAGGTVGSFQTYQSLTDGTQLRGFSAGGSYNAYVETSIVGETPVPTQNGFNNFLGVANTTVASGVPVEVSLAGSIVEYDGPNLPGGQYIDPGLPYWLNAASGSFYTGQNTPTGWNPRVPWRPVAKAISASGMLLTTSL